MSALLKQLVSVGILAVLIGSIFFLRHAPASDRLSHDEAMRRYGFYLEEVSKDIGIDFTHQAPVLDHKLDRIMPLVAAMGAAVSVVDFDRDGWPDIYVINSARGQQERSLSQQGRRHLQGRGGRDGHCRPESGGHRRLHGGRLGRLRQRRLRGPAGLQVGPARAVPQRRRQGLHARHRARPACPSGSTPTAPSGSTTTATASSTCSSPATGATTSTCGI